LLYERLGRPELSATLDEVRRSMERAGGETENQVIDCDERQADLHRPMGIIDTPRRFISGE